MSNGKYSSKAYKWYYNSIRMDVGLNLSKINSLCRSSLYRDFLCLIFTSMHSIFHFENSKQWSFVLVVNVITLFHDRVYTILNTLTHTDRVYIHLYNIAALFSHCKLHQEIDLCEQRALLCVIWRIVQWIVNTHVIIGVTTVTRG